jgi:hypothetical protein
LPRYNPSQIPYLNKQTIRERSSARGIMTTNGWNVYFDFDSQMSRILMGAASVSFSFISVTVSAVTVSKRRVSLSVMEPMMHETGQGVVSRPPATDFFFRDRLFVFFSCFSFFFVYIFFLFHFFFGKVPSAPPRKTRERVFFFFFFFFSQSFDSLYFCHSDDAAECGHRRDVQQRG